MATLTDQLNQQTNQLNQMYDASKNAQMAQLESAYNQNMSNAQAAYNQINPAYQQKANDLAVQYERNRRNANIQAAGNGLNTGTASQMALAQNSAYQRDYGNLRTAQQNALNEAQRGMNDLTAAYNSNVAAAGAQNDFERSRALLDQYKSNYQNQLTLAANLAKYGDFSGYEGIYDSAQLKTMKNNWIAANPDMAYRTGAISAKKYKKLTGSYPAGYTVPSTGGGDYYSGSSESSAAGADRTGKAFQSSAAETAASTGSGSSAVTVKQQAAQVLARGGTKQQAAAVVANAVSNGSISYNQGQSMVNELNLR